LGSDNVVEKWLGSHLDNASDELALGIGVKNGREGVEARREKVAIAEATLCKQANESFLRNHNNVIIPRQEHGRQVCSARQL
jgi:hypothetical protein